MMLVFLFNVLCISSSIQIYCAQEPRIKTRLQQAKTQDARINTMITNAEKVRRKLYEKSYQTAVVTGNTAVIISLFKDTSSLKSSLTSRPLLDINHRFGIEKNTALHLAFEHDQPEMADTLLHLGIDATQKNNNNLTAMELLERRCCEPLYMMAEDRRLQSQHYPTLSKKESNAR